MFLLFRYGFLFNSATLQPLEQYLASMEAIKTDSAMVSALSTFGKYNPTGATSATSRKAGKIAVNAAAVCRRTTALGGRRALTAGRKPKAALNSAEKRTAELGL